MVFKLRGSSHAPPSAPFLNMVRKGWQKFDKNENISKV